jgi:hypothetical protein
MYSGSTSRQHGRWPMFRLRTCSRELPDGLNREGFCARPSKGHGEPPPDRGKWTGLRFTACPPPRAAGPWSLPSASRNNGTLNLAAGCCRSKENVCLRNAWGGSGGHFFPAKVPGTFLRIAAWSRCRFRRWRKVLSLIPRVFSSETVMSSSSSISRADQVKRSSFICHRQDPTYR